MDGIQKAREKGIRFGRRKSLNQKQVSELRKRRQGGDLIKDLMNEMSQINRFLKDVASTPDRQLSFKSKKGVLKMRNRFLLFICLAITVSIIGCASGKTRIISSMDDLTSDYNYKGLALRQGSQLSIPGHIAADALGQLYFSKATRGPYNAFGITKNKSFYVTKTYDSNVALGDLIGIRDKVVELQNVASKIVDIRLALLNDDLRKTQDSSKGLSSDQRKSLEKDHLDNRNDFFNKEKTVLKAINKQGIMIFRWNTKDEKGGGVKLSQDGSEFTGVDYNKSTGRSGFVIVGGFRIKTLFLGPDFITSWKGVTELGGVNDQLIIPTTLLQAKNIIYLSNRDISQYLNAKLSMSLKQVKALLGDAKGLYKLLIDQAVLEINTYMSSFENLSNTGIMGKLETNAEDIVFDDPEAQRKKRNDEWITFYQVSTGMIKLKALIHKGGMFKLIKGMACVFR